MTKLDTLIYELTTPEPTLPQPATRPPTPPPGPADVPGTTSGPQTTDNELQTSDQ